MDLKTLNDVQITRRYRQRFVIGILLLLVLAFPAAIHSFSAIQGLFNRPSDWIPADMQVRIEFDDFSRRFSVADLLLISWDGAKLGADELIRQVKGGIYDLSELLTARHFSHLAMSRFKPVL